MGKGQLAHFSKMTNEGPSDCFEVNVDNLDYLRTNVNYYDF